MVTEEQKAQHRAWVKRSEERRKEYWNTPEQEFRALIDRWGELEEEERKDFAGFINSLRNQLIFHHVLFDEMLRLIEEESEVNRFLSIVGFNPFYKLSGGNAWLLPAFDQKHRQTIEAMFSPEAQARQKSEDHEK